MIILSLLIITCLIIISVVFVYKYKLLGIVVAIALLGSDTDSAGIMYAIKSYFPYWKAVIRSIILVIFIYSIYKIHVNLEFKKNNKQFMKYYYYPLLCLVILLIAINLTRGNSIIFSLSEIIWLGIPFFFIWTYGSIKTNSNNVFINYIICQAILTILILLFGQLFSLINGASYAHIIAENLFSQNMSDIIINSSISIGDFDKNSLNVMKFGQFQNPNALGIYSLIYIITSFYIYAQKKNIKIIKYYVMPLLLIGIIGWFNSLTKGPLIIMLFFLLIFTTSKITKPKSIMKVNFILLITLVLILNYHNIIKIFEYIFLISSNISIISRISGFLYAFDAIQTSPLFGVTPGITDPVPHILPLKIAAYYGLPAAILVTVPFFHLAITTFKIFFKDIIFGKFENTLYPTMLVAIILGAYLSNGVIVYVLFWIILSESLQRLNVLKINFMAKNQS